MSIGKKRDLSKSAYCCSGYAERLLHENGSEL